MLVGRQLLPLVGWLVKNLFTDLCPFWMFVPYQSLDPLQLANSTNSRHYKQTEVLAKVDQWPDETFVVVGVSGDTNQAWESLQTNWGVVQVFQLVRRMKSIRCQEFPEWIRCYETSPGINEHIAGRYQWTLNKNLERFLYFLVKIPVINISNLNF